MSSGDQPSDEVFTMVVLPTVDEGKRGPVGGHDRGEVAEGTRVAERYSVTRRIGKGGMGEVMAARDEMIGRDVAIKRMKAAAPSERAIARFLREATIQGRLEHPAIVPVHEIGRDTDGLPFFVMKKLQGTTLAKLLDGDPNRYTLQRVLRAFAEVCLAVEFAHVRGIVHRDLKPDNIILGDFGEVYVIDWGVAKVIGEPGEGDGESGQFDDVSGSGEHATAVGTAIGTPGYMSPEQARGKSEVDGRADIYTLGCVLFEILAGEALHPRGRDGMVSTVFGTDARPSVRSPERRIAPELDALCVEATALDPGKRIPTARELGDRVLQFLDGDRDVEKRRELGRAHLERAHAAFEAAPIAAPLEAEEARRVAMREAASALALDPELRGAAELVGRLMLEPPRTTPREVVQAIAADDIQLVRANAIAGFWTVVAALAFSPLMWWIAPSGSEYVAGFTAILVVNGILCLHCWKSPAPRPGLLVIGNALLVALLARMFSPILIAPGIAAALAIAMALTPRFSVLGSASTIAALLLAAVFTPLTLEWFGVLPRTMDVELGVVAFRAPAIVGNALPTMIVGSLYAAGLIIIAAALAGTMRRRAREVRDHLHLQAWQLRQLVPR